MSTCIGCSAEIAVNASFCPRCGTPNPEAPTIPTPTGGAATTERVQPDELKLRLQKALGRDFAVGQLLGEGGFAVVFSVQDRKLSRRIAIKVLRPELTASQSTVRRFVREAESVAGLSHPHILPIFFVGEGEGLVYFGMPFVSGETLDARLAREGQLPEADVVRIAAEVADALAEAHASGLVHRDIKPANILLQKGRVLVADFGIAKAASSGDKLTGTGSVIGSPQYMSPEQAEGSVEVDHRSDIYSLGIVLWQMLAGELPFDAPDTQGILVQHLTKPIPSVAKKRPGVSPWLSRVVEVCCAKRPADRFQRVGEVADALRTGRAPIEKATKRWSRKRRLAVMGLSVVALGVATSLVIARFLPGKRTAANADSTQVRSQAPMLAVLPFGVSMPGDTGQLSRQMAVTFADKLETAFGVRAVDENRLLGQWTTQRRSLSSSLDSNAAFAYHMSANQLVVGNAFQSGRQLRVSADLYDTYTHSRIGRAGLDGNPDSLIALLDRLAGEVARAFCGQPEFNPNHVCFDVEASPARPITVEYRGQVPAAPAFYVKVSADGGMEEVRQKGSMPGEFVSAAILELNRSTFTPARKATRAVESWTLVTVATTVAPTAAAPAPRAMGAPDCSSPTIFNANPAHACFDDRPLPMTAPIAAAPASCRTPVTPANLMVRVSATGEVVSPAPLPIRRSNCEEFNRVAITQLQDMAFRPARKAGMPVAGWVIVQVRPR